MSQQSVYNFLKENKDKWFTNQDIAKILGINQGCVATSTKKMRVRKEIRSKHDKKRIFGREGYVYRYKK